VPRRVQPSHGTGQKMDRGRRPFPDRLFFGFVLVALRQRLHRANISRRCSTAPACFAQRLSPLDASPIHLLSVWLSAEVTFSLQIHLLLSTPTARARSDQAHYAEEQGARPSSAGRLPSASWNPTVASPFPGGSGVPDGRKLNTTPGA